MKVLVAGATGALGTQLVPRLIAAAVWQTTPDVIVHELAALAGHRPAPLRAFVSRDQPAAHRGHRPPSRRGHVAAVGDMRALLAPTD